jgi:hypothetical protein
MSTTTIQVDNYIGGQFVPPSTGEYLTVENPADLSEVGRVALSSGWCWSKDPIELMMLTPTPPLVLTFIHSIQFQSLYS